MDDIIIFEKGSIRELEKIKESLNIYYKAIRIVINLNNLELLFQNLADEVMNHYDILLPINKWELDQGIKYLIIRLNPNAYHYEDYM